MIEIIRKRAVLAHAGALTTQTLVAMVPALAMMLLALRGALKENVMTTLGSNLLPQGLIGMEDLIANALHNISFSTVGVSGMIIFAVTSIWLWMHIEYACKATLDIRQQSLYQRAWRSALFGLIIAPGLITLAIIAANTYPVLGTILTAALFGIFYRYQSSATLSWIKSLQSGFLFTVVLMVGKAAANLYLTHFYLTNQIVYGTLFLLPGFVLWVYALWTSALLIPLWVAQPLRKH